MNIFEVCITNYCNFKCSYCISDPTRGCDKFSEPLKLNSEGELKLHNKDLTEDEKKKRKIILQTQGQVALDKYVQSEHDKWFATKDEKHDYTDWLNFDSLISFIKTNLDDSWLINLTGGEPLYYPKVEKLILELVKTHKVLLTTNLSLIRSKSELLSVPRDRLFFRVGYHPEFRSLDAFKLSMDYVIENNFKYIVNYVAHPSYYEDNSPKLKEHLKLLKDNKYLFEVTPFEGKWNDRQYPTSLSKRSEIENKLFSINMKYESNEYPMGTNFMICEPNGDIYECQGRSKQLGNVYENRVSFERVSHSMCHFSKGCPTLKSANMYLKVFLNDSVNLL